MTDMQTTHKPETLGRTGPLLKTFGLGLATLAAFGLGARPAHAQTTINTLPDQNGSIASFGVPDTATYGQTLTVPTNGDSVLQDFTFNVDNNGGTPIVADAEVYAWNGHASTGAPLYRSASFTIVPNGTFTLYTATPNVALTPGDQYAALFTTSGLQSNQPQGSASFGTTLQSSYTGGRYVFINNGDDRSQLSSGSGNYYPFGNINLAFKADFGPSAATPAPEPSSVAAFAFTGLGALGLMLMARRRKSVS